jgi:hypothetical protein
MLFWLRPHATSFSFDALTVMKRSPNALAILTLSIDISSPEATSTGSELISQLSVQNVLRKLSNASKVHTYRDTLLPTIISKTLCCTPLGILTHIRIVDVNRLHSRSRLEKLDTKVFFVLPDQRAQPRYVSMMNCSFASHKLDAVVDVIHIVSDQSRKCSAESGTIQQLANISGGKYIEVLPNEGILHLLPVLFGTDSMLRKTLRLPLQAEMHSRPTCFCHGKIVNEGFVCSVCLSGTFKIHPPSFLT